MTQEIASAFETFAKSDVTKTAQESFMAGWDACRRHYDGMNHSPYDAEELADDIYKLYPRHIGRGAARKAIEKALKKVSKDVLIEATVAYAQAVSRWPAVERALYVPHPATWFNRESWADDRKTWDRGTGTVGIRISQ